MAKRRQRTVLANSTAQDQAPDPIGHQYSVVSPQRVYLQKLTKFNALFDLTPQRLIEQIKSFSAGYLRYFALTQDAIEETDDTILTVTLKRKAAIEQLGYEIITDPEADPAEAEAHKAVLQHFWSNIESTSAIDMNQLGGFSLLVRQMMDAICRRYAVHEVLWKPSDEGLTARFNYIPLWFFENRTGRLRFLTYDFAFDGVDLEIIAPGGWMVTVGPYLGAALAKDFIFKLYALKAWVFYVEQCGIPVPVGKTSASLNTDNWNAMVTTLQNVASGVAAVINKDDEIEPVNFGSSGTIPHPGLVDRLDRAISALVRGADLSTMSAGQGSGEGASIQGGESDMIERSDARLISETLQMQIERKVIAWAFGEGTKPAAYIQITVPPQQNSGQEIEVDTKLAALGVRQTKKAVAERYGRAVPDEGTPESDLVQAPVQPAKPGILGEPQPKPGEAANEAAETDTNALAEAVADDFSELRKRLDAILKIKDTAQRDRKLKSLQGELNQYLADMNRDPAGAKVLADQMAKAFLSGVTSKTAANENDGNGPGSVTMPSGVSAQRFTQPVDSLSDQYRSRNRIDADFDALETVTISPDELIGKSVLTPPSTINDYTTGSADGPVLAVRRNGSLSIYDGYSKLMKAKSEGRKIKAKILTLPA